MKPRTWTVCTPFMTLLKFRPVLLRMPGLERAVSVEAQKAILSSGTLLTILGHGFVSGVILHGFFLFSCDVINPVDSTLPYALAQSPRPSRHNCRRRKRTSKERPRIHSVGRSRHLLVREFEKRVFTSQTYPLDSRNIVCPCYHYTHSKRVTFPVCT